MLAKLRSYLYVGVPAVTGILSVVPALAVDPALPTVAITTVMLQPIVDGVTSNLGVIIPIGIAIFAILLGVSLVPKIIKRFTNA